MTSERKPLPDPFPIERTAPLHRIEDALEKVVADIADGKLFEMVTRLGVCLVDENWAEGRRLRDALLPVLSDEAWVNTWYGCALAGMPGAAEQVATAFARAALEIEVWIAVEGWKLPTEEGLAEDDAAHERLRVAAMASVGWSALAGAPTHEHILGSSRKSHAEAIASEIDAMLWSTVHAAGWRDGRLDGMRVRQTRQREILGKHGLAADETVEQPTKRAPFPSEDGVVVVAAVAADTTTGGKEAAASVKSILGRPLPLVRGDVGKVAAARATLAAEFPHAVAVVDALLSDIRPNDPIRFQPCVIVGDPGGGKSRLVRRLLDLLGVGWGMLDAATTTDMGIIGSPRRWASGYSSLPILTIERHGVANPAIVVDEIEKAGRSTAGSIHDPLLSLLERATARRWRDQFLDAEVDVSHVSWIFTANALDGILGPLRNRLRILRMPRPGREHVPVIAAQVLRDLLKERGIDPRWEPRLDGEEIAAILGAVGQDVSVRDLQRYVAGVLDVRAKSATRN